jgi:ClpP class serine protease
MRLSHLSSVLGEPAYITPEAHRGLQSLFASAVTNGNLWRVRADGGMDGPTEDPEEEPVNPCPNVVVIDVCGPLVRMASAMEENCSNVCSLKKVQSKIRAAMYDPAVTTVVFKFDSPGGQVSGTPETAALIRKCGETKQTIGIVQGQACSGAQWLLSACSVCIAEPSAIVGSIGAYIAWLDDSSYLAKNGYSWEVFRAGEHKAAGLGQPLTDAQRAQYQAIVDQAWEAFKVGVVEGRGQIEEKYMQGQAFTASDALDVGLLDFITDDVEELISGICTDPMYLSNMVEL